MGVLVFILVDHAAQHHVICYVFRQNVVVLISDRVKSSLLKLLIDQVVAHI